MLVRDEIPSFIRPPGPEPVQADKPSKRKGGPRSRFRLLRRFWEHEQTPELPAAAQACWCYLWTLADTKGACYPSMRRIGARLGVSKVYVRKLVARLVGAGYLRVLSPGCNVGRTRANVYRITLPASERAD